MKRNHIFLVFTSILLSACGGVGSDSATSAKTGTDPIDRYIGSWSKICDTWSENDISDVNGQGIRVRENFKLDKLADNKASYVYTLKVYATDDRTCQGEPIATLVKTGDNSQTQTLSGATLTTSYGSNELSFLEPQALQSNITVDKIRLTESKLVSTQIIVGGAIVKLGNPLSDGFSGDALAQFTSSAQFLVNSILNNSIPAAMVDDNYGVWTKQP